MEVTQPDTRHSLGLLDMVSLIVGIVVGTGIFETPPMVFKNVSGPWIGMGVWILVGLLCLIGALCYAELASTYPRSGGDYVYLTRAYGPGIGFLFAWAQLAVIFPANIGMMAYVFSDYAVKLKMFPHAGVIYALSAVIVLYLVNILGFVLGRRTQNVLTVAKVVGLGLVVVVGFCWPSAPASAEAPSADTMQAFAFAMVLVFIAYGGWNDAAYVAAEMRDRKRNIPLSLTLGTSLIIVLYLLVNGAYLHAIGFERVRSASAVATDVVKEPLGSWGADAIAALVMISALGTINGLIFTGSRVYSILGADYALFAWWGRWHPRLGVPVVALLSQAIISVGLITLIGTAAGRSVVDSLFVQLGLGEAPWAGHGGFEMLLRCSAPVFWIFFLLTAVSLFVLRFKDRGRPRPFSVPFYPLFPLIFCVTCAYMVYSGIMYAWEFGLVGGALLLLGAPLYLVAGRRATDAFAAEAAAGAVSSES